MLKFFDKNYKIIIFIISKVTFLLLLMNICRTIFENNTYHIYFSAVLMASILIITLQDVIIFVLCHKIKLKQNRKLLFVYWVFLSVLCCFSFIASLKILLMLFCILFLLTVAIFINLRETNFGEK